MWNSFEAKSSVFGRFAHWHQLMDIRWHFDFVTWLSTNIEFKFSYFRAGGASAEWGELLTCIFFQMRATGTNKGKEAFYLKKKKKKRNFWRRRIMFYDVRRGTSCCTCPTSRMSVEALPMKMIFSFSIFSCFPSERPETESGNFFLFGSKMLILVTVTRWFQ